MVETRKIWRLGLILLSAFGLMGAAAPAHARVTSASLQPSVVYQIDAINPSTLRLRFDLADAMELTLSENDQTIRISESTSKILLPDVVRVSDEWSVRGEWRQVSQAEFRFVILESINHVHGGDAGLRIRGRGPGYWGCVAKGLQGGAIAGAIAGLPGGAPGAGAGLLFGGVAGSVSGAVTCR